MNQTSPSKDSVNDTCPYFAAIDLGSNSFHLLIVTVNNGALEIVDRLKDMVQIARGLKTSGTLSNDAQQRALHCLRCFKERIHHIPSNQIRAVGTKALRSANNTQHFLDEAEIALGHPIDLISGFEEARLIYTGVINDISPDKGDPLIIDIGGGSTEFIIGHNNKAALLESLSIGCVTYSDAFINTNSTEENPKVSPKIIQDIYYATCAELDIVTRRYRNQGWNISVGSSGTMKAIAELMPKELLHGLITREGLQLLVNQLQQHGTLSEINAISAKRQSVLPAGVIILWAIFEQLDLNVIHVVNTALKEGLIYDTIGRLSAHDMRVKTVDNLLEQYSIDIEQAQRVDKTLSQLIANLPSPCVNGVSIPKILHWSALLHEIGFSIAHSGYHNHGEYILRNKNLAGFNIVEQEMLALFVGTHRRKINPQHLAKLNTDNDPLIAIYFACLRLSILLNHRREDTSTAPIIEVNERTIKLRFPKNWLDEHPLTYGNLLDEQRYLAPIAIQLEFS